MIKTDNSKVIENLEKRIKETKTRIASVNMQIDRYPNQKRMLKLEKSSFESQLSDLEQWLTNMEEIQKKKDNECKNE